jgi:DNA-binding MarR family transcriptional regulator
MPSRRPARAKNPQPKSQKTNERSPALNLFMFKVGILRRLIERYSNPGIPARFDTTIAEWRVLTHLYGSPPMTATDLSVELCADKAEVSRACNSLIAKGHVIRRADRADARSTLLAISPTGIAVHDRILPLRQALEAELEAVLGATATKSVHRALDKLVEHFSARIASGASANTARTTALDPSAADFSG